MQEQDWLHADTPPISRVMEQPARKPLYYQDPDGKPDYSQTPKTTAEGRAYKPVYGGQENTAAGAPPNDRGAGA